MIWSDDDEDEEEKEKEKIHQQKKKARKPRWVSNQKNKKLNLRETEYFTLQCNTGIL